MKKAFQSNRYAVIAAMRLCNANYEQTESLKNLMRSSSLKLRFAYLPNVISYLL